MSTPALIVALSGTLIAGVLVGWVIGAYRAFQAQDEALDLIDDLCDQAAADMARIELQSETIAHYQATSNVIPIQAHDWLDPENTDVGSRLRHPSGGGV